MLWFHSLQGIIRSGVTPFIMKYLTKFIVCITVYLLLLSSCSPPEDKEKPISTKPKPLIVTLSNISLTLSDISKKYRIDNVHLEGNKCLPFLKKPLKNVSMIQQTLTSIQDPSNSNKIVLLILKFDSAASAKKETDINFNILETMLKRKETDVETFSVNIVGDNSIGVVFANKISPVYLYCRINNIFVKINGGKNLHLDELIKIIDTIKNKIEQIK